MLIKPTYATFEQSVLLKEKGFNVECSNYYLEDEIEYSYPNPRNWNLNLGIISMPEQWMVVEWLRITYNLWINVSNCNNPEIGKWCFDIHKLPSGITYLWNKNKPVFNTPQEAYSAAFDYILNNVINY